MSNTEYWSSFLRAVLRRIYYKSGDCLRLYRARKSNQIEFEYWNLLDE